MTREKKLQKDTGVLFRRRLVRTGWRYMSQASQQPEQLMIHVDDMEIKTQHCSCGELVSLYYRYDKEKCKIKLFSPT